MIRNIQELSASLYYMASWADMLEGLRRHAQEMDATLLPLTSAGPLSEVRWVLAEAREFVDGLPQEASQDYHLPVREERGMAT